MLCMTAMLGNISCAAARCMRSAGMVGAMMVVEMYTRTSAELPPAMPLPRSMRRRPVAESEARPHTKAAPWVG